MKIQKASVKIVHRAVANKQDSNIINRLTTYTYDVMCMFFEGMEGIERIDGNGHAIAQQIATDLKAIINECNFGELNQSLMHESIIYVIKFDAQSSYSNKAVYVRFELAKALLNQILAEFKVLLDKLETKQMLSDTSTIKHALEEMATNELYKRWKKNDKEYKRILLIHPDKKVREKVKQDFKTLRRFYHIETADSYEEAEQILKQNSITCILFGGDLEYKQVEQLQFLHSEEKKHANYCDRTFGIMNILPYFPNINNYHGQNMSFTLNCCLSDNIARAVLEKIFIHSF